MNQTEKWLWISEWCRKHGYSTFDESARDMAREALCRHIEGKFFQINCKSAAKIDNRILVFSEN